MTNISKANKDRRSETEEVVRSRRRKRREDVMREGEIGKKM